jgi:hypothetical protein
VAAVTVSQRSGVVTKTGPEKYKRLFNLVVEEALISSSAAVLFAQTLGAAPSTLNEYRHQELAYTESTRGDVEMVM